MPQPMSDDATGLSASAIHLAEVLQRLIAEVSPALCASYGLSRALAEINPLGVRHGDTVLIAHANTLCATTLPSLHTTLFPFDGCRPGKVCLNIIELVDSYLAALVACLSGPLHLPPISVHRPPGWQTSEEFWRQFAQSRHDDAQAAASLAMLRQPSVALSPQFWPNSPRLRTIAREQPILPAPQPRFSAFAHSQTITAQHVTGAGTARTSAMRGPTQQGTPQRPALPRSAQTASPGSHNTGLPHGYGTYELEDGEDGARRWVFKGDFDGLPFETRRPA